MKQSLNGTWQLHFIHPETQRQMTIPARVPGNVLGDLERAELIPDPYFGTNSWATRKWEFTDWEYTTDFEAPRLAPGERLELSFDAVDTVFELFLNDVKAGAGRNMFIEHRFDVTDLVRQGEKNALSVRIKSSVNEARKYHRPALPGAINFESLGIRRAAHTYGWDIAPRLVGAGIWRSVTLEVIRPTRLGELYCFTTSVDLQRQCATMTLQWNFETDENSLDDFSIEVEMTCGDSHVSHSQPVHFVTGCFSWLYVPNAKFWWPLGSGEQNLYTVTVRLLHRGKIRDERSFRCGIREIRLERTDTNFDGNGKFLFKVNGRPTFIKGSNWVPLNAIHGEQQNRLVPVLELFRELRCNMIRCWGGNVYEDHDFFDWCDENGIMIWQDFMLACVMAPQDTDSLREFRAEAESVIRRLRQHPSLALWAGDNECDEQFFWTPELKHWLPSDNLVTRQVFRRAVFENDPVRDYLPSSPYLCDELRLKNARYASPEQHLWGPRDNCKSPFYRNNNAIFASEIGYHGMLCVDSMKKFLPAESLDARTAEDPNWLCHAAQAFGNDPGGGPFAYRIRLMQDQVEGYFGSMPDKLEDYIEASQIVQAEAMKYFVESFRMAKWKKTGLIWWNVMDCWPQFSDAVVDYYGCKKLAFHYIKASQQPVLLAFDEPDAWCIRLHAVNDLDRAVDVRYKVTDFITGEPVLNGTVCVGADSACVADSLKINQGKQRIYKIEYEYEGGSCVNHYVQGTAPVPFEFYHKWYAEAKRLYCCFPLNPKPQNNPFYS